MAMEPGMLNDLHGDAQDEWDRYIKDELQDAASQSGSSHIVADGDPDLLDTPLPVDWGGMPVRIRECLQSQKNTNRLLDWNFNGQPYGRIFGQQEEYLEWLVKKDTSSKVTRIEMTTETPEYWRVLAKHHPARTLQILGEFANEPAAASASDVYGSLDPFNATPQERESAFVNMIFPQGRPARILSPYNNGSKTIAFMTVGPNTLHAAIFLAAFASIPYVKIVDGQAVPLTGREAIRHTRQAAQDCRDSDPTIVGSVCSLVVEGKKVALMDPMGLYIADVDNEGLLLPDEQTPAPRDWFRLTRGSKLTTPEGTFSLSQRLVLEVPPGLGFVVGDLVDANTGEKITHGGQIASKVTVSLYAKASRAGIITGAPNETSVDRVTPCRDEADCSGVKEVYEVFEETQSVGNNLAPSTSANRGG